MDQAQRKSITDSCRKIIHELQIIFPDELKSTLEDAIHSCRPINLKELSTVEWLERCVNHILLKQGKEDSTGGDTAVSSPVQSSSTVSSSLADSKNGVTQHMVQQVENMFPNADREWILTSLVYSKQCFSDNSVDRTCNYMLEYPMRYKRKDHTSSFEPTPPKLLKHESSGNVKSVGKFNTSNVRELLDLGSDSSDDELDKPAFSRSPSKHVNGAPSATVTSSNKLSSSLNVSNSPDKSPSIKPRNLIQMPRKTNPSSPTTSTTGLSPSLIVKLKYIKDSSDAKISPRHTGCWIPSTISTSSSTSTSDTSTSNSDDQNPHAKIKQEDVIQSQNKNSLPDRALLSDRGHRRPLSRSLSDTNSDKRSTSSTPVFSQSRRATVSSTSNSLAEQKSPLRNPENNYKVQRLVSKISPTQSEKLARRLNALKGSLGMLGDVSSSSPPGADNKRLSQDVQGSKDLSGQFKKKTSAQPRPVPIPLSTEPVSSSMQFRTPPIKLSHPYKVIRNRVEYNRRHSTPAENISPSIQSPSTPPVNPRTPSESQPSLKKTNTGMSSLQRTSVEYNRRHSTPAETISPSIQSPSTPPVNPRTPSESQPSLKKTNTGMSSLQRTSVEYNRRHSTPAENISSSSPSPSTPPVNPRTPSESQPSLKKTNTGMTSLKRKKLMSKVLAAYDYLKNEQNISAGSPDTATKQNPVASGSKNRPTTTLLSDHSAAFINFLSIPNSRERLKQKVAAMTKCCLRDSSELAKGSGVAVSSRPFPESNKTSTPVGQPLESLKRCSATVPSASDESIPNISTTSQNQNPSYQNQTAHKSVATGLPHSSSCLIKGRPLPSKKPDLKTRPATQPNEQMPSGLSVVQKGSPSINSTASSSTSSVLTDCVPVETRSRQAHYDKNRPRLTVRKYVYKDCRGKTRVQYRCVTRQECNSTSLNRKSQPQSATLGTSDNYGANKAGFSTSKETTQRTPAVTAGTSNPKNKELIFTGVSCSNSSETNLSKSMETMQPTLSATVEMCSAKNTHVISTGVTCSDAHKTAPSLFASTTSHAADKPLLCDVTKSNVTSTLHDALHSPDSTFKPLKVVKEDATSSQNSNLKCEGCSASFDTVCIFQCCEGHVICTKCVEKGAKQVLSGESKGNGVVMCPCTSCSSSLPRDNLARALPSMILDLLDEKWTQENLLAIGQTNELVKCPGCDFAAFVDVSVEVFQCMKDLCRMASCRHCHGVWSEGNHKDCGKTEEIISGEITPQEEEVSKSSPNEDFPSHWTETKSTGKIFVQKLVQPSSKEWANVRKLFAETLPDAKIRYINRVQNLRLWKKYVGTRQNMLEDNGETGVNEKKLFHGTRESVVENICRDGFDWRMCGRHGVLYGQGAYFAGTAVYSHRYSSLPKFHGMNVAQNSYVPWRPQAGSQHSFVSWGPTQGSSVLHHIVGGPASQPTTPQQFFNALSSGNQRLAQKLSITDRNSFLHQLQLYQSSKPPQTVQPAAHMTVTSSSKTSILNTAMMQASAAAPSNTTYHQTSVAAPSNTTYHQTSVPAPSNTNHPQSVANMLAKGRLNMNTAVMQASAAGPSKTANQYQIPARIKVEANTSKTPKQSPGKGHHSVTGPSKKTYHPQSGLNMLPTNPYNPTNQPLVSTSATGPPTTTYQSQTREPTPQNTQHTMFLARVLVGRTAVGKHGYRKPPLDPAFLDGRTFDSCTDNNNPPQIFVIFDTSQAYPEYVITYTV